MGGVWRRVVDFLWWPPRRRELRKWVAWTILATGGLVAAWLLLAPSETTCRNKPLACGAGVNLATTLLVAVAVGVFWFRIRTRFKVTREYLSAVRSRPGDLLQTAPSAQELERVEPRRELYRRVAQETRQLPAHTIQAVEGDAGSGKTVALLGIAQYLARRGCVPVLVSLRGATMPLDFMALARQQFLRLVDNKLASDTDGDRLWRQLCGSELLVILADGLDEVTSADALLDSRSLLEFRPGDRAQAPVVVTSRPRALPERWRSSTFAIGQLGPDQVEHYLTDSLDAQRRSAIANRLDIARTPFYLTIVARLAGHGRLAEDLSPDSRTARRQVLDTYLDALADDGLGAGAALGEDEREAAVVAAGSLAYSLLLNETDGVAVDELSPAEQKLIRQDEDEQESPVRLIGRANELGLLRVRTFAGTPVIRFRHPILQAHLAARVMRSSGPLGNPQTWQRLAERARTEEAFLALQTYAARTSSDRVTGEAICSALLDGARTRRPGLRLPLTMCAAEVARECALADRVGDLCDAAEGAWPHASTAAKLTAVEALARLAPLEAGLSPDERRVHAMLWRFAADQPYAVEWKIVGHLGRSGSDGYHALEPLIGDVLGAFRRKLRRSPNDLRRDNPMLKVLAKFLPRMADLVALGDPRAASDSRESLARLVTIVGRLRGQQLGIEASLAQGFKEAGRYGGRSDVEGLIVTLIDNATFWFTRINAIHALTRRRLAAGEAPSGGVDVRQVLDDRALGDPHDYVQRAARLCRTALDDEPANAGRYIWDDESEAVAVASDNLHPDAHRLVGEMVVVLNMNEQLFGDDEARRERTQRAVGESDSVPRCLETEHSRHRMLGVDGDDPCADHADCPFHLCPYRPQLAPPTSAFREVSADFCRHERTLATGSPRRRRAHRRFWNEIEQRSAEAARSRAAAR